ncbi:MAG: hypothetical protein DMF04_01445 [Verrucomicrobia bacterium]|nr:MAG: hypothetical protein DMF04_01445 [Verrucomicrobiota bacterium]
MIAKPPVPITPQNYHSARNLASASWPRVRAFTRRHSAAEVTANDACSRRQEPDNLIITNAAVPLSKSGWLLQPTVGFRKM